MPKIEDSSYQTNCLYLGSVPTLQPSQPELSTQAPTFSCEPTNFEATQSFSLSLGSVPTPLDHTFYDLALPTSDQQQSQPELGAQAHTFPCEPTNFEATQPFSLSLGSVPTPLDHTYDLALFDINQPTEKLAEGLSSAAQETINLDDLCAQTINPPIDENLQVPLMNPVPNPADNQVQCEFIMTQSDEPNNNEVPGTSKSLPAQVKKRGRKKDSPELKELKAQIKNDEKQKRAERIKQLRKQ